MHFGNEQTFLACMMTVSSSVIWLGMGPSEPSQYYFILTGNGKTVAEAWEGNRC